MKRFLLFLAGLSMFWACNTNKNLNKNQMEPYNFEKSWEKIASLEEQGLYKSANLVAEEIYQAAKSRDNTLELIKSLLYRAKYTSELEEDGFIKALNLFEQELSQAGQPEKSILQSILAELYDGYLMQNLWKINQRKAPLDDSQTDIREWAAQQFVAKSTSLYLASLTDRSSIQVPLKNLGELIIPGQNRTVDQNNLYELLANRAMDYFRQDKYFIPKSADSYVMKEVQLFAEAKIFAQINLDAANDSNEKQVLLILQELTKNYLESGEKDKLAETEIQRMIFVYQNWKGNDAQKLYLNALYNITETFSDHEESAEAWYLIASNLFHNQSAEMEDDLQKGKTIREAHTICVQTIEKYPGSVGADQCKSLLSQIESKTLGLDVEQVNLPDENIISLISYKNISKIYLKIVAFDRKAYEKIETLKQKEIDSFVNDLPIIHQWEQILPAGNDFMDHKVELSIGKLPKGSYSLVISDNPDFVSKKSALEMAPFFVSNLAYWQSEMEKSSHIYVTDRTTGSPKSGIRVDFFTHYYDGRQPMRQKTKSLKTNNEGYVVLEDTEGQRNMTIEMSDEAGDELFFRDNIYPGFKYNQPGTTNRVLFFMDRTIYRPGQTAYFKGLLYEQSQNDPPKILPGLRNIEITLYDANHQKAGSMIVSTNEFGSFSGSFALPASGLPGTFNLVSSLSQDRVYFNVEEYKRPTFTVSIDPYDKNYKLGDSIVITGTAAKFADVPLSNARITYRFRRSAYWPWWSYSYGRMSSRSNAVEIESGSLLADENGRFRIPVRLLNDDLIDAGSYPHYRFELEVDAMDLTGETHTATSVIIAGANSKNVEMTVPEHHDQSENLEIAIEAKNWNGLAQTIQGKLKIIQLDKTEKIFRDRFWSEPDMWIYSKEEYSKLFPYFAYKNEDKISNATEKSVVLEKDFDSSVAAKTTINLAKGHYKITFTFMDDQNKPVTITQFTEVFGNGDIPGKNPVFLEVKGGEPGQKAEISLLSKIPGQPVILEVLEKKEIGLHRWEYLKNKKNISYTIEEKHRGDIHARIVYVYNNRIYTTAETIRVPWSNKELTIEYVRFRNRLLPGEDEEWELKIKGNKQDKILAEMLATLYDASLDDIKKHNWFAGIYSNNYLHSNPRFFGFETTRSRSYTDYYWNEMYYSGMQKTFHSLNWFGMEPGAYRGNFDADAYTVKRGAKVMAEAPYPPPSALPEAMDDQGTQQEMEAKETVKNGDGTITEQEQPQKSTEIQIRKNLNETVFFYPHLRTDKEGNIIIRFKMNEALTSWRFLAFAHTKDLAVSISENQVVTAKDFMVMPNIPRFVRTGDELWLSTQVSNRSEVSLSGKIELQLLDALTEEHITTMFLTGNADQSFEIPSKGIIKKSWQLTIPEQAPDLLKYRIIARSGNVGDGEEGLIPVLSNRQLVTETLPMWFSANSQKTYEFTAVDRSLKSGGDPYKLTMEFTSHPAWYVIQALPYIQADLDANSIQLANALFINALGNEIVRQNPAIKRVFDKWSVLSGDQNPLKSQLDQNKELKNILLEETPWVLDAQNETAQKRNIALLFNLNQVQQDQTQIIQKLKALQEYDGGFSWYPGGRSNQFITLYILESLGKLDKARVKTPESNVLDQLKTQALEFVDNRFVQMYNDLLESAEKHSLELSKDHLSDWAVYYLYVRSYFPERAQNDEVKKATIYYLDQCQKYWLDKGIFVEGLISLVLHRFGNQEKAKSILSSLEERSVFNEELGRYWKTGYGFDWFELPIETQSLMVEAFNEIRKNDPVIDQMKIWLIKNKQTNIWRTPKSSVAAIHALLQGSEKLLSENQLIEVKMDGNSISSKINPEDIQAGTGYFKVSWNGNEVIPGMEKIDVKNPNKSIAWGAAYWQFFQTLDKIDNSSSGPLKISRQLNRVVDTKTGERLEKLSVESRINPGDKLMVSLRIETDRPMDFVHLKDQRSSALEPLDQTSGYEWNAGLSYYKSSQDAATNFFIEHLPKGVFVIQYPLRATHSGAFSNGIALIQSFYAPDFSGHSEGTRIRIANNE